MVDASQGFPKLNAALVDRSTGVVTQPWLQFFISLWQRTGGALPSGQVNSVTVISTDGITSSVVNPTASVEITLGLDSITPSSVTSSGQVVGSNLSGNNTGDVTLAGENYLSLTDQVITVGQVDLSTSNVTGILPSTGLPALSGAVTSSTGSSVTSLGSFSSAELSGAITDETGTGLAVFNDSPTFGTKITTPEIVFNSSSGIIGATTGAAVPAGSVGEIISSTVLAGAAVSLTSPNDFNITSISLTAGDWDLWGNIVFVFANTTVPSAIVAWISTVSATPPTAPNEGAESAIAATFPTTGSTQSLFAGMKAIKTSGATTVYLSGRAVFSTSTATAYGYIGARRRT